MIPTLGSKEAIFCFAQVVLDLERGKNAVAFTEPGYPVYERGALFAGARPLALPLLERARLPPRPRRDRRGDVEPPAVFWVNYPNNPTGATAPLDFYERLARARRASTTSSSPPTRRTPSCGSTSRPPRPSSSPTGAASPSSTRSRSARSMTGYRCGFVAGDPELVAALKAFRPTVGTAPQEFVQRASVVAWGDEEHVERTRALYARKRALFLELFRRKGLRVAGSEATMYLWVAVPAGETSESFAERLLEHGILVAPGSYLGAAGEGYVRLALVPTEDDCRARGRDPRGGAVTPELAIEIVAALDRGERRVAEQVDGEWVVDVEAKKAILLFFRLRKVEPMEVGGAPLPRQDPGQVGLRRARRARRAAGSRAVRLVPLARASS